MTTPADSIPPSGSSGVSGSSGPGSAAGVVGRLRDTFATGLTRPVDWRLEQLRGLARLLDERESDIASALAADLGRSAHDSWFGDVAPTSGEVKFALRHLARWVRPQRVGVPLAVRPGRASYRYEPLGVVLVIAPWNYPFYLSLGPMVGALAAGNCVVLKPSEHAPASSTLMADLVPRYVDDRAVAVVEGEAEVTQELIDARMDHVFFTGGTAIGRVIMEAAARHLTPVTLELGGKSPAIVTSSADVEVAARRIAFGKLLNSGQTCVAPDYVLVDNAVKDQLVDALVSSVEAMRAGASREQPIVNERQRRRLEGLLDPGEMQGARVVGGTSVGGASGGGASGGGASGGGASGGMAPTVVVDPPPESALMREEIFGPILPVVGVDSLDEAIAHVNAGEKPLAAYIFSDRRDEQERVFRKVPAGGLVANQTLMHLLAPNLPFGGVGSSGMGAYHGKWGFETFSHRKAVLVTRARPDLSIVYPPYSEWAKKVLRRLV